MSTTVASTEELNRPSTRKFENCAYAKEINYFRSPKCQRCAWLARKWLEIDDKKTKDLKERLTKLVSLENQLSRRLKMLSVDIQKHEKKLEKETNELQKLLNREERTKKLEMTLHGYENRERET
uniref:Uncharacterized protein n=1 Tax=Magallana gigas TaxID=29159 RepID=A0A8W8MBF8_MAGGI